MRYPSSRIGVAGFGQLELMLALALGSGLCLVAAQHYQYAVYISSIQEQLQQRAERILVLKLTTGTALQRALYRRPVCLSYAGTVSCPDWLQHGESPDIVVEAAHASVGASIVPDGDILTIHGDEIYGATQYFTARHITAGHDALR